MGLGVRKVFSREKNMQIILEHYRQDPKLTVSQLHFLKHFPAFGHKKGNKDCECLGCEGIKAIKGLRR